MEYEKGGMQKDVYSEAEVEHVRCPLCSGSSFTEIYRERRVLGVVKCLDCSLIFVNPRLKNPEKTYWGDPKEYFKEARLIFEGKSAHHRDCNYRSDIRRIYKLKPKGNFLDVGTNMGFFLRNARGMGWDLYGVEPSGALADMARKYFGLNVKTAFLEEAGYPESFFDVVTMTDVFEHLGNPHEVLKEVHRILKYDGILFIKVPNGLFNILKFKFAKFIGRLKDYDIFDSYEHVVHYTQGTLSAMLKKYGFRVVKTIIGRPVQVPAWHCYVGQYYQYPTPYCLDFFKQSARAVFYFLSLVEYRLRLNRVGYLAPNIIAIAKKAK